MPAEHVILVTGGGGFIGSRFAEILFLTRFARVRVGVRRWEGAARAARFPVDIVLCDVLDSRQVVEALNGVSVVVHCAAGDPRVIVEGTQNVLDAAGRAGVSRVIHLSTAEVYGPGVSGRVDESWPCVSNGSAYAAAKIEAEHLVSAHSCRGLPVTVFRPSIVYGPWSEQWTAALAQRLRSGRWGRYQHYGDGTCNVVYVDDLVAVALASIHADAAVGEIFNVGGPDVLTWNEYFERFNAAMGLSALDVQPALRAKIMSVVTGSVRASAHAVLGRYGDALMRIYERGGLAAGGMRRVKGWLNTHPSSTELEHLYSRKATYDWSKAARMLGYRPAFDLDRGLRLSVDWLRDAGM